MAAAELFARQPLEDAVIALAQSGFGAHRMAGMFGNDARRMFCAAEIAAVQRGKGFRRKPRRDRERLRDAGCGQIAVTLALDADFAVPHGLSVAHQNKFGMHRSVYSISQTSAYQWGLFKTSDIRRPSEACPSMF